MSRTRLLMLGRHGHRRYTTVAWSPRSELHTRHLAYKASALLSELLGQKCGFILYRVNPLTSFLRLAFPLQRYKGTNTLARCRLFVGSVSLKGSKGQTCDHCPRGGVARSHIIVSWVIGGCQVPMFQPRNNPRRHPEGTCLPQSMQHASGKLICFLVPTFSRVTVLELPCQLVASFHAPF